MANLYNVNKGTQGGESFIVASFWTEQKADNYVDKQRDQDKYVYFVTVEQDILKRSITLRCICAAGRSLRSLCRNLSVKGTFQLSLFVIVVLIVIKTYLQYLIYRKG